jgi:hypothetical protein
MNGEAVLHRVERKDAWQLNSRDCGLDWPRPRSNKELVIGEFDGRSIAAVDLNCFPAGVHGLGGMAGKDLDARELCSMGQ